MTVGQALCPLNHHPAFLGPFPGDDPSSPLSFLGTPPYLFRHGDPLRLTHGFGHKLVLRLAPPLFFPPFFFFLGTPPPPFSCPITNTFPFSARFLGDVALNVWLDRLALNAVVFLPFLRPARPYCSGVALVPGFFFFAFSNIVAKKRVSKDRLADSLRIPRSTIFPHPTRFPLA